MKIGIIGAGHIGQSFAKQVANAGYEVLISNSRGPETLTDAVQKIGGNTKAVTVQEAALADVVFLSVVWNYLQEVTTSISTWQGRIVIDATNPVLAPHFNAAELNGRASSEVVSEWAKGARVVKAFNTFTPELLAANPKEAGGSRVIFYSSNDNEAKDVVAGIIKQIGFEGIFLGKLNEGGRLQQFPGGPLAGPNLIRL
jgi:8-hydroxy-5-deazaflavin:NADPH oxidoreductase